MVATRSMTQRSSVVSRPKKVDQSPYLSFIFRAAEVADQVPVWSPYPHARDRVLRAFWRTEKMTQTAITSTVMRYASMEWSLSGPPLTREVAHDFLNLVQDGYGLSSLISRTWLDVFTQDNGGFWQIIRSGNSPDSECIGLKHLDAAKCRRTGVYDQPVVYWDDLNQPHVLRWYEVCDFVDLPASEEIAYGASASCAVSRILEDARYMRDVAIYQHEKVSGRNPRAIHFIGGVSGRALKKALEDHKILSENKGSLYIDPPIVPGNDPTATVSAVTLEMASLYDGFDEDKAKRWFYVALSNAIGVDYQEFAPMPAGNLGTSQQSNTLSMKGNAKGPALFQAAISHAMNYRGILPRGVEFNYYERDPIFEAAQLDLRIKRGQDRTLRLDKGELTPAMARQLAVQDGDLPAEYLALAEPPESLYASNLLSTGPGGG